MDDPLRREIACRCDPNLSRRAATAVVVAGNLLTPLQQHGARGTVQGTIHTTATCQLVIGSIDDDVDLLVDQVTENQGNGSLANLVMVHPTDPAFQDTWKIPVFVENQWPVVQHDLSNGAWCILTLTCSSGPAMVLTQGECCVSIYRRLAGSWK
jgi:hypothetical protein